MYLENGFSEVVLSELAGMGHQIDMTSGKGLFGGIRGFVRIRGQVFMRASESRKMARQ